MGGKARFLDPLNFKLHESLPILNRLVVFESFVVVRISLKDSSHFLLLFEASVFYGFLIKHT